MRKRGRPGFSEAMITCADIVLIQQGKMYTILPLYIKKIEEFLEIRDALYLMNILEEYSSSRTFETDDTLFT